MVIGLAVWRVLAEETLDRLSQMLNDRIGSTTRRGLGTNDDGDDGDEDDDDTSSAQISRVTELNKDRSRLKDLVARASHAHVADAATIYLEEWEGETGRMLRWIEEDKDELLGELQDVREFLLARVGPTKQPRASSSSSSSSSTSSSSSSGNSNAASASASAAAVFAEDDSDPDEDRVPTPAAAAGVNGKSASKSSAKHSKAKKKRRGKK